MLLTSSEAAKLLRQLNEELETVQDMESNCRSFVAAISEDVEAVRPQYDFFKTQKTIVELQTKIRKIKHAVNVFNTVTVVPGFDMTIDQMLVYLPQLSSLKSKYFGMRGKLQRSREYSMRSSSIIEYSYLNYNAEDADSEYKRVADLLSKAQTALDVVNNSVKFEIDI